MGLRGSSWACKVRPAHLLASSGDQEPGGRSGTAGGLASSAPASPLSARSPIPEEAWTWWVPPGVPASSLGGKWSREHGATPTPPAATGQAPGGPRGFVLSGSVGRVYQTDLAHPLRMFSRALGSGVVGIQTQQVHAQSRETTLPRRGTAPAQRPSGLRRGPRSCSPALPSRLGSHRTAGVHDSPSVCRAVSRTCAGQGVSTSLGHTSGTSGEKTDKQTPRPSSKMEWRHSARQRHEGGGPAPLTDWRKGGQPRRAPSQGPPAHAPYGSRVCRRPGPCTSPAPGPGPQGPHTPCTDTCLFQKSRQARQSGFSRQTTNGTYMCRETSSPGIGSRDSGDRESRIYRAGRRGVSPPGGHAGLSSLKKSLQLTG